MSEVPLCTSARGGHLRERGEREFFINNLLVRIHLIMEMISVDRPGTMEV